MKTIKPPRLKPGDKIGIVSPSRSIQERIDLFKKASKSFETIFDVNIIPARYALGRHYFSAGSVEERVSDIHSMFSDKEIKGVISSVGGNSLNELVDKIDYSIIKNHPKICVGISNFTVLQSAIFSQTGLITFSGLEFTDFAGNPMDFTIKQIKNTFFEGKYGELKQNPKWSNFRNLPTNYKGWQTIRPGTASGKILGTNYSGYSQLLNTKYSFNFDGNILAFETYKFTKEKVYEALIQLKLHGVLKSIRGLIIGYLLDSDSPDKWGNELTIKDVVLEATREYDFPIMEVGEIGHKVDNYMLPIGAKATMDATNLTLSIDEPVVI